MKTAFKISLTANILLGTVVCCLITRPHAGRHGAPGPVATDVRPDPQPPQGGSAQGPAPAAVGAGFDWRQQVESRDYPTYIANLRAIHCPEQTVRDIIKADVASLFAPKRKELSNSVAVAKWSPAEEARLVAVLFDDHVPQTDSVASADSESEVVTLPLILQTQALATLKLTDDQGYELKEMRQEFIQEIGGANQDPNDPAYLKRWQKAQPKFDELVGRAIGSRALVDLEGAIPPAGSGRH